MSDFFVLDTDPPPTTTVQSPSCLESLTQNLRSYVDSREFSDVTFVVEGRPIYGHRIILCMASERFRAMFSDGFRESREKEIIIPDRSHLVFSAMMEYLYTGRVPSLRVDAACSSFEILIELLECADQYMLDHLKQTCEALLEGAVDQDTVHDLLLLAERSNACQLGAICRHFIRNQASS